MTKLKVKTFGWKNRILDQISRINEGLINNNCVLTDECPDLVYSNNDMYDDILEFSEKQDKKPFIILNVLDLQIGNPSYNIKKVRDQLLKASAITCISKTVQKQIKDELSLESHVIYNPIKDVQFDQSITKKNLFLYVGRANDKRKRFILIKDFIKNTELEDSLIVCGSEYPDCGKYAGIINDNDLNYLYNASKFLLLPSSFEGLGLPMIEAMVAGTIPITCEDNLTANEFCPKEFISKPDPTSILNKAKELNRNYNYYRSIALEAGIYYKKLMNKNQIAKNIIDLYQKTS